MNWKYPCCGLIIQPLILHCKGSMLLSRAIRITGNRSSWNVTCIDGLCSVWWWNISLSVSITQTQTYTNKTTLFICIVLYLFPFFKFHHSLSRYFNLPLNQGCFGKYLYVFAFHLQGNPIMGWHFSIRLSFIREVEQFKGINACT